MAGMGATDSRLGRIFLNRTIKVYPAFQDFFGMEDTIERIVGYFTHAAQGLEERKQILYLLGPVGGGKSSLAERLKELMESFPIYALAVGDEISPVFESPLGLFSNKRYHAALADQYSIDKRYLNTIPSPWAIKRLKQFGLKNYSELYNPDVNARAAYQVSNGGKWWKPWSTYNDGTFLKYLDDAKRAKAEAHIGGPYGSDGMSSNAGTRTKTEPHKVDVKLEMHMTLMNGGQADAEKVFQHVSRKLKAAMEEKEISFY